MKWVIALLFIIIGYLQYRLWFGEGSVEQIVQLQREIEQQKVENNKLEERNRALLAQIKELKEGTSSIEDISERLGFADRHSFSRAFRRWSGQTPSAFRRQARA